MNTYLVSEAITDLRSEFEGGKSLSLDFPSFLKRGARNVLDNINPETLKRRVPIFGGVSSNMMLYYCPEDVRVPVAIYRQPDDREPIATYTAPSQFVAQQKDDVFTLEYINGVRFLMFRQTTTANEALVLEEMDTVGTKISDSPLAVNTFNFISGQSSLERLFTSSLIENIECTSPAVIDITDLLRGVVMIPMVFKNAQNIKEVRFRLMTDDSNYYNLTSTTDSVGDNFIDGLNAVRLSLASATKVGTPNPASIAKWQLFVDTEAGTTEMVIIDRITIQKTAHYYFEYYSNRMFIDATSKAWKETPTSSDLINLAQEARDILHYETVLLISQGNTKIRQNRNGFDNFATQLARKYQQYWGRYPSSEAPITYNTLR